MKFTDFNLSESLLAGLRDVQFLEPTPVQEKAIPIVTAGKDLIATAQTGTGKTGAFVIPIMERVLQSERKGVKALILSPTRELASQIDEQIFAIGYHAGITSATVIGGSDFSVQAKALKAGVDIIVATPGRLIDQKKIVNIDFSNLEYFVLDEADRMLDMGFLPDMKKIISWLPVKRQTLLFSATMPSEIQKLAGSIMKNPESVSIERSKPSQQVEQRAYTLLSNQKVPLVKKIFKDIDWDSCIIFTSTKKGTDELQRLLKKEGIKAASIHGDRSQDERNKALAAFKNNQVPVIVATDVLARGIDIKGVSIIINYDVPNSTDDYIHRIGRTGRYDKTGIAITFVTRRDNRTFQQILQIKGNSLKKIDLPDNFGERSAFSWGDDFTGKNPSVAEAPEPAEKGGKREKSPGGKDQKRTKSPGKKSQEKPKPSGNERGDQKDAQKQQGKSQSRTAKGSDNKNAKTGNREKAKKEPEKSAKQKPVTREKETAKPVAEKIVIPPVVEKAVARNKKTRKPSKGLWGIIKTYIPKI